MWFSLIQKLGFQNVHLKHLSLKHDLEYFKLQNVAFGTKTTTNSDPLL